MDATTLTHLLCTLQDRQFWLKPVGEPNTEVDESERYDGRWLRIDFSKQPAAVAMGDILLIYRVGIGKLVTVAECVEPAHEATPAEIQVERRRERWNWSLRCANCSPEYARHWREHELKPFELARSYGEQQPNDRPRLGSINFGSDKVRISPGFGAWILHQIILL